MLVEIVPRQWVSADSIRAVEVDGVHLTVDTTERLIVHEFNDVRGATSRFHRIIGDVNGHQVSGTKRRITSSSPVNTTFIPKSHVATP
jgi:hypothetical protein